MPKMNTIVAFGNPLLDTTVLITDNQLLHKYNLKNDGQKQISGDEMTLLLQDISTFEQKRSPGGCGQNTLRVIEWLLGQKCTTAIYGGVGRDENGRRLRKLLEKDGVCTRYTEIDNIQTGTTVALVSGVNRSLVAHLGAAEALTLPDLTSDPDFLPQLQAADLVYMEGFFLTERLAVAEFVLENAQRLAKTFAFNICSEYMCERHPATVLHFAERCDVLFGNRREFQALADIGRDENVEALLRRVTREGGARKIAVVTDGARPVIVAHTSGEKFEWFRVPSVDGAVIVDTTGAGDAFVAGFLTGLILQRTPLNCSELGCYAAQEIMRRTGCTLPSHHPNVLL